MDNLELSKRYTIRIINKHNYDFKVHLKNIQFLIKKKYISQILYIILLYRSLLFIGIFITHIYNIRYV